MNEKQLAVFDTTGSHLDLLGLVRRLENLPDLSGGMWEEGADEPLESSGAEWLKVEENPRVSGLFDICQDETRQVVRVVKNQIWVSNRKEFPYKIEIELREGRVPYRLGYVEPDWKYVEGREVKPQKMSRIVEVTFIPRKD